MEYSIIRYLYEQIVMPRSAEQWEARIGRRIRLRICTCC